MSLNKSKCHYSEALMRGDKDGCIVSVCLVGGDKWIFNCEGYEPKDIKKMYPEYSEGGFKTLYDAMAFLWEFVDDYDTSPRDFTRLYPSLVNWLENN